MPSFRRKSELEISEISKTAVEDHENHFQETILGRQSKSFQGLMKCGLNLKKKTNKHQQYQLIHTVSYRRQRLTDI